MIAGSRGIHQVPIVIYFYCAFLKKKKIWEFSFNFAYFAVLGSSDLQMAASHTSEYGFCQEDNGVSELRLHSFGSELLLCWFYG